jgi:hypothetical protein
VGEIAEPLFSNHDMVHATLLFDPKLYTEGKLRFGSKHDNWEPGLVGNWEPGLVGNRESWQVGKREPSFRSGTRNLGLGREPGT